LQITSLLYALLYTEFGGDGRETFHLPKLAPVKSETGKELRYYIAMVGLFPSRS
jgi:microcystin-dependent protein